MLLLFFLFLWQLCCDASLITSNCTLNRSDERLTRISKLPCPSRPVCQCYVGAVDCSGRNLTRLPSNLTNTTTTLLLNNNSFSYFPDFYHVILGSSNNISVLDLSYNKISSFAFDSIESLKSLQYIDLRYNAISSSYVLAFSTITLQAPGCLLLGHNSVKHIISYYSFLTLIQTQFIDFSFNNISTLSKNFYEGFNFSQISLSGNKLQKFDLNYFYINQEMQELDVSNNLIVNITNEDAIQLSSLKSLNLSHNNLTNIFPNIISQLPTLEVLDFSFNRLSDFESFTSLSNLSLRIYAEGNPWECNCNSSALYRQLSGKHTFACRDGGDECLYCATPENLTGVLIQNTCSQPKTSENSSLTLILLIIFGILAIIFFGIGIGWKIRQRKLKKGSTTKLKQKNSYQETQLPNNKAVTSYNSTAINSFEAHQRSDGSKGNDNVYPKQINLQQKSELAACNDESDYVQVNVTAHQAKNQSTSGSQDNYENSNTVHSPLHTAETPYYVIPETNLSYRGKEESFYVQPIN